MNSADLDARNTAAIRRHARSLADNDMRATRPLLDDLAAITEEYAVAHAERVTARRELREQASTTLRDDYGRGDDDSTGAPPPVAADTAATAVTPSPSSAARTRTRTRGGAK